MIFSDIFQRLLGLYQKEYIDQVLKRFSIQFGSTNDTFITISENFSQSQYHKNDLEKSNNFFFMNVQLKAYYMFKHILNQI